MSFDWKIVKTKFMTNQNMRHASILISFVYLMSSKFRKNRFCKHNTCMHGCMHASFHACVYAYKHARMSCMHARMHAGMLPCFLQTNDTTTENPPQMNIYNMFSIVALSIFSEFDHAIHAQVPIPFMPRLKKVFFLKTNYQNMINAYDRIHLFFKMCYPHISEDGFYKYDSCICSTIMVSNFVITRYLKTRLSIHNSYMNANRK